MSRKLTVLLVAQRPSDFNEMKRAIKVLAAKGHNVDFLYISNPFDKENTIYYELFDYLRQNLLHRMFLQANEEIIEVFASDSLKNQLDFSGIFHDKNESLNLKNKRVIYKFIGVIFFIPCMFYEIFLRANWKTKFKRGIYRFLKFFLHASFRNFFLYIDTLFLNIRNSFSYIKCYYDKLLAKILQRPRAFLTFFVRSYHLVFLYKKALSSYTSFLSDIRVDLIIFPEDIVGLVTPLLVRAAKKFTVKTLILPYTICNQEEAFQSLKDAPLFQYRLLPNRLVGMLCRKWVMKRDGHAILRLPAPHVIGHYVTRAVPPDPWMMNSGYADIIAVETKKMFDYYCEAGIPAERMQIVGALYDDVLAHYTLGKTEERKKLYVELGLSSDKKLLVIGGCPDQTSAKVPHFDFVNMVGAVAFIADVLKILQVDFHVVVRPHPNFIQLGDFFKQHGIPFSLIPTDKLIALADVYLGFASATIRWAIACGVPTINYDIFHYDYGDYKKVPGVLHVAEQHEFVEAVKLISQQQHLDELIQAIGCVKHEWGTLDGKSGDRICQLIEQLCAFTKTHQQEGLLNETS